MTWNLKWISSAIDYKRTEVPHYFYALKRLLSSITRLDVVDQQAGRSGRGLLESGFYIYIICMVVLTGWVETPKVRLGQSSWSNPEVTRGVGIAP